MARGRQVRAKKYRAGGRNKNASFYLAKKAVIRCHQEVTKPLAKKDRQEWTLQDIEYLKIYGAVKCIRELALDLGRTYVAVQNAGHRFRIDMRGNKMGINAQRFKRSTSQ